MVEIKIPGNAPEIEKIIDDLIIEPHVRIKDVVLRRRLGIYAKPAIDANLLGIYYNRNKRDSIAVLHCKTVKKKHGRGSSTNYLFPFL